MSTPVVLVRGTGGQFVKHVPHNCGNGGLYTALAIAGTVLAVEGVKALARWLSSSDDEKAEPRLAHAVSDRQIENRRPRLGRAAPNPELSSIGNRVLDQYAYLERCTNHGDLLQTLGSISRGLHELESRVIGELNGGGSIGLETHIWDGLQKMNAELKASCNDLKATCRTAGAREYPRFTMPRDEFQVHRTLNHVAWMRAQIDHAVDLSAYLAQNNFLRVSAN